MDDNWMFILFALIVMVGLLAWRWLGLFYAERKERNRDNQSQGE